MLWCGLALVQRGLLLDAVVWRWFDQTVWGHFGAGVVLIVSLLCTQLAAGGAICKRTVHALLDSIKRPTHKLS